MCFTVVVEMVKDTYPDVPLLIDCMIDTLQHLLRIGAEQSFKDIHGWSTSIRE